MCGWIFLLNHDLLLFDDKLYEEDGGKGEAGGDEGENLLTVNGDAEEGIAVLLDVSEKAACKNRGAKAGNAADAVFDGGGFDEVGAVYIVIGDIDEILDGAGVADSVEENVQNDQPAAGGGDEGTDKEGQHEEYKSELDTCGEGMPVGINAEGA